MRFRQILSVTLLLTGIPAHALTQRDALLAKTNAKKMAALEACEDLLSRSPRFPREMSDDELLVFADQLMENGHPYGEYLTVTRRALEEEKSGRHKEAAALRVKTNQLFYHHAPTWTPTQNIDELHGQILLEDKRGILRGLKLVQSEVSEAWRWLFSNGADFFEKSGYDALDLEGTYCTPSLLISLEQWTSLSYLNLRRNHLDNQVIRVLKNLPHLTRLNIGENHLNSQNILELAKFPHLTHLDVSGTNLGRDEMAALASNRKITHLGLRHTQIGSDLVPLLAEMTQLEYLDLSYNRIDASGLEILSQLPNLKELNLSNNRIRLGNSSAIPLSKSKNLTRIDLTSNYLGVSDIQEVLIKLGLEGSTPPLTRFGISLPANAGDVGF